MNEPMNRTVMKRGGDGKEKGLKGTGYSVAAVKRVRKEDKVKS